MSSDVPKIVRLTLAAGLALLLLLILVTAGIAGLLASESGTRWVAGLAVDRLGGVRWGDLRGSMLGRLEISDLEIDQAGFRLEAERVTVAWRPGALLGGELQVSALALQDGVLTLRQSDATPAATGTFNPADLAAPVDIDISGVALDRLSLVLPDAAENTQQTIDALTLAARLSGDHLELTALELRTADGSLSLQGSAHLRSEMPVELTLRADGVLPAGAGSASGSGPQPTLHRLSAALALDGSIDWREGVAAALTYRGSVQGMEGLAPELPDRLAASGRLSGRQRGDVLRVDAASLALEDLGLLLQLRGEVSGMSSADPRGAAELAWENLRWPLASAAPLFQSAAGSISMAGGADDYRLTLDASAAGADLPASHWTARTRGDSEAVFVEALRGELFDGWVEVTGPISLGPQPRWDLHLRAGAMDLSPLLPELTAPLEGSLSTRGQLDAGGNPSAAVDIEALRTAAAGFPVELRGALRLAGEVLEIGRLDLQSGSARLSGEGSLSATHLDVNWTLALADAGSFVPGASGRVDGGGRLSGHPEAPQLDAALTAAGLGMEALVLENLSLELVAGFVDDAPLELRLSMSGLGDQEQRLLDQVTLRAAGSTADHRMTLAITAAQARLDAELAGGLTLAKPAWQGRLLALGAEAPEVGAWDLETPSPLAVAAQRLRLDALCLDRRTGAGRICVDGAWQASEATDLELELTALPLEAFLPTLTGDLTGTLEASIGAGGALAADGRFELGSGVVRLPDDLDTRSLAHGGGHLDLAVGGDGLSAGADFAAPEGGRVDLVLHLPALQALPPGPEQPLEGRIGAELPDLAVLAALAGPIGQSTGQLSARLELAGSLAAPRLDGDIRIQDGSATVPVAGLDLREIELRLAHERDNPELLTLTGGLRSGRGRLEATGFVNPDDSTAVIRLRGESLQAFDTADARVLVSPDLALDWSREMLRVRGLVTVPRAELTPRLKIGAATAESPAIEAQTGVLIGPSPDVVILGGEAQPGAETEAEETPLRIDAELGLVLGRDVTVRAVGLVTRLEGAVGFSLKPEQSDLLPIARGGVSLVDGTFRSFGQDLDIETGQVLYTGVPVTEPEVFLRAVRWIDSDPTVSAVGVQLSGPGTAPELELFSRPPLDAAEIQSYLLTGTGTGENSTVLAIGTQLTDRVYVGYGYNLLEETSEFDTLFSITPRFGVGADVGEADSNFNLMFTYEK